MKKVAFHNLGCKVNSYELDAMQELFLNKGYKVVDFDTEADVYVVNTCSVTNIADRKSRQMLSKARKNNPEAVIVAVGCYVETREEELLKEEQIDLCIGNNKKGSIVNILEKFLEERESKIVKDQNIDDVYETISIADTSGHTRAFIKVQDGCNQFCTYCIIPFARGRARSRKKEDVLSEIKSLTLKGYSEFVITGIHLSSYGSDFVYEKKQADQFCPDLLMDLIKSIADISGVKRIRLGSLEPRIMSEEFVKELSSIDKICPHFHLSLQSGCDATLKRMNRHYSAREYEDTVHRIREYFNHPAITTDVIVGFPGETEDEFEECRQFLDRIKFFELHIFKYSKRHGTVAATLPNQLTEAQKTERSHILEALDEKNTAEYKNYYLGKNVSVLFEEKKNIDGKEYWVGHTKEYIKIKKEMSGNHTGDIMDILVEQGSFIE